MEILEIRRINYIVIASTHKGVSWVMEMALGHLHLSQDSKHINNHLLKGLKLIFHQGLWVNHQIKEVQKRILLIQGISLKTMENNQNIRNLMEIHRRYPLEIRFNQIIRVTHETKEVFPLILL